MTTTDSTTTWRYPASWKNHLLCTHPSGVQRGVSRMAGVTQLHSMRRDEGGAFNDLWMGKPDFTPEFERALEASVRDMRAEQRGPRPVETIAPDAIDRAIERVRRRQPALGKVLGYFQTPPKLRHWDPLFMAAEIGVSVRTLYRMRGDALLAVWLELPAEEKAKVVEW